jgi:hypothetical protein
MGERDGQETQDAPADCYKMRRTQLFTDVPRWAAFAKFNFESEDGGSREDGEMFLNCIIYNTNGWDSRKSQFQSKYTAEINGGVQLLEARSLQVVFRQGKMCLALLTLSNN